MNRFFCESGFRRVKGGDDLNDNQIYRLTAEEDPAAFGTIVIRRYDRDESHGLWSARNA